MDWQPVGVVIDWYGEGGVRGKWKKEREGSKKKEWEGSDIEWEWSEKDSEREVKLKWRWKGSEGKREVRERGKWEWTLSMLCALQIISTSSNSHHLWYVKIKKSPNRNSSRKIKSAWNWTTRFNLFEL